MATHSKTTDWLTTRASVPATYAFTVNGKPVTIQSDSHYPLLWALRDDLKLTGTKFGCGIGECAVCLVDVDGKPTHSCITPVSQVVGKQVTTIEGLATDGKLTAVQQAWVDEQVPQCGWCQSGQIMMAEALLREHPKPTDKDMDGAMFQVLCRCGTYPRIKQAIKRASLAISDPRPGRPSSWDSSARCIGAKVKMRRAQRRQPRRWDGLRFGTLLSSGRGIWPQSPPRRPSSNPRTRRPRNNRRRHSPRIAG